jgi:hypothetical protein
MLSENVQVVFNVFGGKLVRLSHFLDQEQARAVAGLTR